MSRPQNTVRDEASCRWHTVLAATAALGGPEQCSGDSRGPGPLDPSNPNIRAGLTGCPPVRVQLTAGWASP